MRVLPIAALAVLPMGGQVRHLGAGEDDPGERITQAQTQAFLNVGFTSRGVVQLDVAARGLPRIQRLSEAFRKVLGCALTAIVLVVGLPFALALILRDVAAEGIAGQLPDRVYGAEAAYSWLVSGVWLVWIGVSSAVHLQTMAIFLADITGLGSTWRRFTPVHLAAASWLAASISRFREQEADAYALSLTGDPEAVIGALTRSRGRQTCRTAGTRGMKRS